MEALILPAGVSPEISGILIFASFFTSLITATIGLGGGILLLAIMASFMPAAALIPVHGIVQLGSNMGRAWLHRAAINTEMIKRFALGSMLGAALGAALVVNLPAAIVTTAVGFFVLYVIWAPPLRLQNAGPWTDRMGGAGSTFLSIFFGATGPFVSALIKSRGWSKAVYMGTFSGCMTVQNSLKTVAFLGTGFDYVPWIVLMAGMVASGYAGTHVGTHFLNKVSEETFSRIFKYAVSLIALRLIWSGLNYLMSD